MIVVPPELGGAPPAPLTPEGAARMIVSMHLILQRQIEGIYRKRKLTSEQRRLNVIRLLQEAEALEMAYHAMTGLELTWEPRP